VLGLCLPGLGKGRGAQAAVSVANQEKRSVCDVTLISDKICSASNCGEELGQGGSLWNQTETNSSLGANVRFRGTGSVAAMIETYWDSKYVCHLRSSSGKTETTLRKRYGELCSIGWQISPQCIVTARVAL